MGKSEIILLIVSVVLGIAIMAGMVVPIMQDGKDMVQVKDLSQEISAVKDRVTFKRILNDKQVDGDIIKVSGTNFLEASGVPAYPHKAKNTGALFTDITFKIESGKNFGTFDINLAGTEADKIVDLKDSESLQKICDAALTKATTILTCKFKVE